MSHAPVVSPGETCPSCGYTAPAEGSGGGPVDPYGASSPSCWAAFGRLQLAGLSQLALDAYMAQHPGLKTVGGRRSVLTHLVGLWWVLDRGVPAARVASLFAALFPDKREAPPAVGPLPVLVGRHVGDALDAPAGERAARTEEWARFVWSAWSALHPQVRLLGEAALRRSEGVRP
jgi:hypothetical protein